MIGKLRLFAGSCRRAFTLMEIMVASSLSLIVAAESIGVMIYVMQATTKAHHLNQTAKEARLVSDLLARDIRGAAGLQAGYQGFSAGEDTLILRVPSIDDNEDVIDPENAFDRIIYHPGGEGLPVLVREVIPNASSSRGAETKVIGNLMTGKSFKGTFATMPDALGAYVIHYQLSVTTTFRGQPLEMPVSGSVRFRNRL